MFNEAKFMHFSDWPYPKPWVRVAPETTKELQPDCDEGENGEINCRNRVIWRGIYDDFRKRREDICGKAFRWDRRRMSRLSSRRRRSMSRCLGESGLFLRYLLQGIRCSGGVSRLAHWRIWPRGVALLTLVQGCET